jgi:general nucleoside transport system ATP-binding protein
MKPRLELRGITKRYPSVVANENISLNVPPGVIHAILGENGAGKSTLMKIIYGAISADEGEILWNGEVVPQHSPAYSRAIGIEMVYQHFALFESVSVVENIALTIHGRFDLAALAKRVREISAKYGLPIDPFKSVHQLSVGERQRVEIVRCLLQSPKLLILDEPTSVLTPNAVTKLFETLRLLAAEGCSILYISHKLAEVKELCGSATVLKNGRVTGTIDPRQMSTGEIARLMVGTAPPETQRRASSPSREAAFEVRALSVPADVPFGVSLLDISFSVASGEILGIAGISGNGQTELVQLLSGEKSAPEAHMVQIAGIPSGRRSAAARRRLGLAFVPEERLGRGAVPPHNLGENGLLTAHRKGLVRRGFVNRRQVRQFALAVIDRFGVRTGRGPASSAQSLSGGNLQKFIVGREIGLDPRILLVSQPTWGVDVGASAFIRQTLVDLSRAGAAVIVISEDLDELMEISDRVVVMSGGMISESLPIKEARKERIGELMVAHAARMA